MTNEQTPAQQNVLRSYLFELPDVGKREARRRLWNRLCLKYWPTTVLRHKAKIESVLARAEEAEGTQEMGGGR